MNTKYTACWLLCFLFTSLLFAQCPSRINDSSVGDYLQFEIATDDCSVYPDMINVQNSLFRKVYCDGEFLEYILHEGDELLNTSTFSADMQFNRCDYLNGILNNNLSEPDIIFDEGVKIFPNPVERSDFVVVKFDDEVRVHVNMIDITGKIVLEAYVDNENKIHLDVDHLNTGMYLIHLVSDQSTLTRKILIR